MKTVTSGAHYTTVEVDTAEAVKFSFASTSLSVEASGGDITVALTDTAQAGDDETITVPDGESRMFIHHRMNIDTYYLTGTGKVNLWASNIGDVNPFKGKSKGGDGGSYSETVLWENTGTTNPDTITLSEAWSDFDELAVVTAYIESGIAQSFENIRHTSIMAVGGVQVFWYNADNTCGVYVVTSSTVFTKKFSAGGYYIQKIIGIKYGSGGGTLGALAYKDTASGSYTPAGSVSVAQSPETYVYDGTTGLTTYTEAGAPSAAFTGTTENITVG